MCRKLSDSFVCKSLLGHNSERVTKSGIQMSKLSKISLTEFFGLLVTVSKSTQQKRGNVVKETGQLFSFQS